MGLDDWKIVIGLFALKRRLLTSEVDWLIEEPERAQAWELLILYRRAVALRTPTQTARFPSGKSR